MQPHAAAHVQPGTVGRVSDDDFELPDETFDDAPDEVADDLPDGDLPDANLSDPLPGSKVRGHWEAPEPTGVQAVDDALTPLRELDDLPTAEHVPYYEAAHRQLQDALADLDGA